MIWMTIMVDTVEVAGPLVHSQTHIHPFNHVTVQNSRSKHLLLVLQWSPHCYYCFYSNMPIPKE